MNESDEAELRRRIRASVIGCLRTLASRAESLEYERTVGSAAASELFCQWFDDLYRPEYAAFRRAFSPDEAFALDEVNRAFEDVSRELGDRPPTLARLFALTNWPRLERDAQAALRTLGAFDAASSIDVLALDLERTLIDDARRARPRPGLRDFLDFCHASFARVAVFTTVDAETAREVVEGLEDQGHAPPALVERLEYVAWSGTTKDLSFVPDAAPERVLIVDDDAGWIAPAQRDRWIAIAPWDGDPRDRELWRVRRELEARRDE